MSSSCPVGARCIAVRYDRPPLTKADLAETDLKTILAWVFIAIAICAVLVVSRDPARWLGIQSPSLCTIRASSHVAVPGSNQPAAPRETPEEEQMSIGALEIASDYAESTKSRALIVTRHGYIVY